MNYCRKVNFERKFKAFAKFLKFYKILARLVLAYFLLYITVEEAIYVIFYNKLSIFYMLFVGSCKYPPYPKLLTSI